MYKSYKATGIIIKRINYKEADKILVVFTREYGKIKVLAKSIRKITSRRAPQLELFNYVKLNLIHNNFLDVVSEVETQEIFPSIRSNLKKIAYTYELVELIDRLCPEREEYQKIFDLSLLTLKKLENGHCNIIKEITENFIHRLLWELGYLPRNQILKSNNLEVFVENIIEKSIKSRRLINKIMVE